ncbi:P-loop containing nucleoside triphosphate hydrolase protein, partial [Pavlovales sp. CCMP2436]
PHAFDVAASCYRRMLDGVSQAVVISGESGAGKTETFMKLISYLSWRAPTVQRAGGHASFEQLLLATVPALESFGNASTKLNHNSSRYGKFISLIYTGSGRLAGIVLKCYLLEKTRVIQ